MRGNMDSAATQTPEIQTGIDSCPLCRAGLAGQALQWQEQAPMPGQRYGRQLVDRRLYVIQCSQRCGWIVSGEHRKELIGHQPNLVELGLPERCARGHFHSWAKVRRFGNRADFTCAGLVSSRNGRQNQPCQVKAWVWLGDYHGFLKQRAATPYGETRNKVLGALANYPEGATLREIVQGTGLKQTTVLGCLGRMLKARYAYVWRTDTPLPLPVGLGHRYGLTDRGWLFISWAFETGVYQETEPD